jgi:predicted  nucleic acid-binding Zn-ribbon protein
VTDLADLLTLQELDTRADQLRHRRDHLPERAAIVELDRRGVALRARRAEITLRRDELAEQEAALGHRVELDDARRRDIDKRLKVSTVPKEVQALSDELAALAKHQLELEDQELELMEAIEPLDAQLAEIDAEEAEIDRDGATQRAALAEAEVTLEADVLSVAAARQEASANVPPALLSQYEKLRPRLGGIAVARLDAGRCTGCHLQLPATELDRLRHEPADALVTCEQCGRLLVR